MRTMGNGKKIFWGVLFVLAAVAVIVGQLGYLGDLSFWSVLISIGLIGLLVEGCIGKSFGTVMFALAFLAIVNDKFLGIEALTPWPVLGAAALLTIGLNILFPRKKLRNKLIHERHHKECFSEGSESVNGEDLQFAVSFGQSVKYVTSQDLKTINAECAFGSLEIYLNNAVLKDNAAEVIVDGSFGSIVLYIPSEWNVTQQVHAAFGGVDEQGRCNPMSDINLTIKGDVSFGALELKYI